MAVGAKCADLILHGGKSPRQFTSGGGHGTIENVDRDTVTVVLNGESPGIVIDVREADEIEMVGELSHNAENVSLQHVMEGAFGKDQDDFEDDYGFPKPQQSDYIIFSCAAG